MQKKKRKRRSISFDICNGASVCAGFAAESVLGGRHTVAPECHMWPEEGKWKESHRVVSFYKVWSITELLPKVISQITCSEKPKHATKHCQVVHAFVLYTSDTQINKHMHADTKHDTFGCPVAC